MVTYREWINEWTKNLLNIPSVAKQEYNILNQYEVCERLSQSNVFVWKVLMY